MVRFGLHFRRNYVQPYCHLHSHTVITSCWSPFMIRWRSKRVFAAWCYSLLSYPLTHLWIIWTWSILMLFEMKNPMGQKKHPNTNFCVGDVAKTQRTNKWSRYSRALWVSWGGATTNTKIGDQLAQVYAIRVSAKLASSTSILLNFI